MAGSNFHQLKFKSGMCTRYNTKRGEVTNFDCTPSYAVKEKVNLTRITAMKKLGLNTENLDILEDLDSSQIVEENTAA